jgi:cysteine-rich repeat protein
MTLPKALLAIRPSWWLSTVLILFFALIICDPVFAGKDTGSVRVFMSATGQQDTVSTTGNTLATLQPGELLHIEVWVEDSAQSGQLLNGWQLFFPTTAIPKDDAVGSVSYVDNPPDGASDSVFLIKSHPIYVFASVTWMKESPTLYTESIDVFGVAYQTFPGQGVDLAMPSAVPNPGGPNYLGEFDLLASPNARGRFELEFLSPMNPYPTLFTPAVEEFFVDEFQPLTIAVFNCGDGILDVPEECDDGQSNSDHPNAACRTDCTLARCGDNIVDTGAGETCDGSNPGASGCRSCRPASSVAGCTCCADGAVQSGGDEACDDGNAIDADGCSGACTVEPGFECGGAPSICTLVSEPVPTLSRAGLAVLIATLLAALQIANRRRLALQ